MLHDPRANATPSQLKYAMAHNTRVEKIASRAKVAEPIVVTEPEPVNELAEWIGRQMQINPLPWFSIEEDLGPVEKVRIKIHDIQHVVGQFFEVSRTELIACRRTADVVFARQVAIYLAKKLTPRSLPEIGRRFGDRDHTTILHSVRKIEALRRTDEKLESDLQALALILGASL